MTDDDTTQELPGMPPIPAPEPVDQDESAPHGRKADGTPKRRPGRKPAGAKRPTTDAGRARQSRANKTAGYRTAIAGMMQLVGLPLVAAGRSTGNPAFLADAVAVANHAEPIAAAVADLAVDDARIAAVLDKLTAVGPYSALLAAVSPLLIQLGANHGVIAVEQAVGLGAVPPDELVGGLMAEAARQTAQAPADGPVTAPAAGNGHAPAGVAHEPF